MALEPKKIFLLDALGALLSAFLLGIVLVQFEAYIGMPLSALYPLAFAACIFFIYSTSCYLLIKKNWKPYLIGITMTNSLYCLASFAFVIYHFDLLTALGLSYFIAELTVLILIIYLEFKTVQKMR